MKKIFVFIMIYFFTVFSFAFASGTEEEVSYRGQLASMSWGDIVDIAKKEGKVSWFVWYYVPQFRKLSEDFEKKYGITVTIPEGTLDGNITKLLSEIKLPVGSIDIIAYGADKIVDLQNALYGPIDTIIPDIESRKTGFPGFNTNGYALAYWGNQTGIAYDPRRIKEQNLPQTRKDLERYMKENPKKFAFNFDGGGAGPFFIFSIVRDITGEKFAPNDKLVDVNLTKANTAWKWFNDKSDLYVITNSNADTLTRINDGEFILGPAWEDHAASLQNQGAISKELKFYIPAFGMPGGGNVSSVVKNSPHPAAALVFLEWLTSIETQTRMVREFGIAPQNINVDDSYSLVPKSQRKKSTNQVPVEISKELRKLFNENVLLK